MANDEEKPKKGVAGKNTGAKARAAIRKAKARGATTKTIAEATNRDDSTIQGIASGEIKNPPSDLADNVAKAKAKAKSED